MQNTGSAIWNNLDQANFVLKPVNPEENFIWGVSAQEFAENVKVVAPGQMVEFVLELRAPFAIGRHIFQWQMNADGAWFGDQTNPVEIWVGVNEHELSCYLDRTSLNGKILFNYKGIFGSSKETGAWRNYFHDLEGKRPKFDYWPAVDDMELEGLIETDFMSPSGKKGMLYEALNPKVVDQHFNWMAQYQLDGIMLERNIGGAEFVDIKEDRNQLLEAVSQSAQKHGRVFNLKYDFSKDPSYGLVVEVLNDWVQLIDEGLLENTSYLWHKGHPVVALHGIGFESEKGKMPAPDIFLNLIQTLKFDLAPKYRATVVGFVPSNWNWQELSDDAEMGEKWRKVFSQLDVISPWSVGEYASSFDFDIHLDLFLKPDQSFIKRRNEAEGMVQGYMPVLWPGLSNGNKNLTRANYPNGHDLVSRENGSFFWYQAKQIELLNAEMLFVNSFDDLNEGTAIYKLVADGSELPMLEPTEREEGYKWLAFEMDGWKEPSDWYLQLSQRFGQILRNEKAYTGQFQPQSSPSLRAGKSQSICYQEQFSLENLNLPPAFDGLDEIYWEYEGVGKLHNSENLFPVYEPSSKEKGKSIKFVLHGSNHGNCMALSDTLYLFVEDCQTTAIKNIEEETFEVYPNPFYTSFGIRVPRHFLGGQLLVLNINGVRFQQLKIESETLSLDGGSWPSGIYFIRFIKDNQTHQLKVIK